MKRLIILFLLITFYGQAQTGIGTTTPKNKFQIEAATADPATSGSSANGNLRLSGSGATHALDFGLSSTSTYSWLQARSTSAYDTYYNLSLNPNGGRVGIGNTSPAQALDVTGTGKFSAGIINNGGRTYLGKDGANMQWLASTDNVLEPNNLAYGFESNGTSIQSHKWYIGGVEKMKMSSVGKLGIGTSTPSAALQIQNENVFSGADDPATNTIPSLYVYNSSNSSTSAHALSLVRTGGTSSGKPYYSLDVNSAFGYSIGINNPSNQLIINTSWNFNTTAANNAITINRFGQSRVAIPEQGGLVASDWPGGWGGGIATYDFLAFGILANSFNTRSDRRLKNILELDSSSISNYLKLRPVSFYWNPDKQRDTKLQYGFIAQEIESIFPEMVNTGSDEMQTKSVNYQALHALSLKVIQAQQAEIEALKNKQIDLENRLKAIEEKLK
jgi:hypothetical protein